MLKYHLLIETESKCVCMVWL